MVCDTVNGYDVVWYDVRKAPFALYGFHQPQTEPWFRRMPFEVAASVSPEVEKLSQESAGGRVRFATDSPYIAIRAAYRVVNRSPHTPMISTVGFDLYRDDAFGSRYIRDFRPPMDMGDTYEQVIPMNTPSGISCYTINFPVHSTVESLQVGLAPGAQLGAGKAYRDVAPLLFYGSSIVHGIAAGHPGTTYENHISRMLEMDYRNFGFCAAAKGEPEMARYLASLSMSVFVCDYDHNAPDLAHLEATHHPFYQTIREKNPDVPYLMVTKPDYWTNINQEDVLARRDIIMRSYLRAREAGDTNVYFVDGTSFFADALAFDCSMDSVHPNDLGFVRMGECIGTLIRHILSLR